jgi:hypothetical protein
MMMPARIRNAVLTAHVTSSVGWFGAVAAFLALAVTGLSSANPEIVRSVYIAMELVGWFVIVPFSLASLVSGLAQSLGTEWGLFRHHWIIAKLFITVVSAVLLLVHMQPVGYVAQVAIQSSLASPDLDGIRVRIIADSGGAMMALFIATTLSVFKPRGVTAYGKSKQSVAVPRQSSGNDSRLRIFLIIGIISIILLFAVLHLTNPNLFHH